MILKRIDEIFHFEKGTLQSSKCVAGKFDFITAAADWKTHNSFTHNCEALIFAAAASGSLGRTHYVNGKFISSDLCFIITPKDMDRYPIDLKFYHILFNELKLDIVRNTKAGTSKEAIGLASFGRYELPYFSLEDQSRIKQIYLKINDQKSALNSELYTKLNYAKSFRQQILQDAISGKLSSQNAGDEPAAEIIKRIVRQKQLVLKNKEKKNSSENFEIQLEEMPFQLPSGWVWAKLGIVAEGFQYGSSAKSTKIGKVPVLRMGNIQGGAIDWTDLVYTSNPQEISQYSLKSGDLLFNRTNSRELVGKTALYDNQKPSIFAGYLVRFSMLDGISAEYANIVMNSILHKKWCEANRTDALGQSNINATKLRDFPFPLPPLQEQSRITDKVAKLLQYVSSLESCISNCITLNEKLLKQVLRESLQQTKGDFNTQSNQSILNVKARKQQSAQH